MTLEEGRRPTARRPPLPEGVHLRAVICARRKIGGASKGSYGAPGGTVRASAWGLCSIWTPRRARARFSSFKTEVRRGLGKRLMTPSRKALQ
jgi:hypothetical protein